jgi:hypothetical protein
MLLIDDCLNNQFKLYTYLNKINNTIIQYLDNNNVNINYYCIFEKNGTIITSSTTKIINCGYRLIKVSILDNEYSEFICNTNLIRYENMQIEISDILDNINMHIVDLEVKITNEMFISNDKNRINLMIKYSKDDNEKLIEHVDNVDDLKNAALFENIKTIHYVGKKYFPSFSRPHYDPNLLICDFPLNLHTLKLGGSYRYSLPPNILPKNLHTLDLGLSNAGEILPNVLPSNLHTLKLSDNYDHKFMQNVIPSNLHTLILGDYYSQEFDQYILPPNLNTLILGKYYYEHFGPSILPQNLNTLILGKCYNKPFGPSILPLNLQNIVFGDRYKFKNKKCFLPSNLKSIVFGNKFVDKKLPKFPSSIISITFGSNFNNKLDYLPPNLQTLAFGELYSQPFINPLPKNLKIIYQT